MISSGNGDCLASLATKFRRWYWSHPSCTHCACQRDAWPVYSWLLPRLLATPSNTGITIARTVWLPSGCGFQQRQLAWVFVIRGHIYGLLNLLIWPPNWQSSKQDVDGDSISSNISSITGNFAMRQMVM